MSFSESGYDEVTAARRILWGLCAALLSGAATACGAEALFRVVDGYSLTRITLVRTRPAPSVPSVRWTAADVEALARQYALRGPLAAHIDPAWYAADPPPVPRADPPDWIRARLAAHPNDLDASLFEFNRAFLRDEICGGDPSGAFGTLTDFLFFDPVESGIYPSYRHLRHVAPPDWFAISNFGWRGPDVALNKPPHTIRLALVGSSTVIGAFGFPFSYPELINHWLNLWSASRGWPYRFETINAGRTGVDSHSLAAIVRQELVPVEPDLVIFYEGGNQFWPGQAITYRFGRVYSKPTSSRRAGLLENQLAIARRLRGLTDRLAGGDGREPLKPFQLLRWPDGVDEANPDPFSPRLPMALPAIVADLESMRSSLHAIGSELAVSSFVWMVHDGMRLDLSRSRDLFDYLNRTFWPVSYRNMRRLADDQNLVFRNFAARQSLPFIDIAAEYPRDPLLFNDAVHMKYPGVRLQAWLYLQHLAPMLESLIGSGALPRQMRHPRDVHPAFANQLEPRVVTRSEIRASCSP